MRMQRKENPLALLVEMQIGATTIESSKQFFQKSKNGFALWYTTNSTSGNIAEKTQNTNLKECTRCYIHCSIIYNSQDLEAAQVPIGRWVDKKAVIHLHNGILLGHKQEGNFILCSRMDGTGEHYPKWNKPVRERQVPYDFTYMWNLVNKIY